MKNDREIGLIVLGLAIAVFALILALFFRAMGVF